MMKNKDAARLVKDAGDILNLFGTKAKVEVEIAPAEETLAAGHAERISSALAHVGRGVSVLQELINLAARRPNPQTTPIGIRMKPLQPALPLNSLVRSQAVPRN